MDGDVEVGQMGISPLVQEDVVGFEVTAET
jgi:hypothetical protein